ncbi:MAG: DUF72 domain-containing protein [Bacteroidota bacterium]
MEQQLVHYFIGIGGWEHEILDNCFYPRTGMTTAEKLAYYSDYFSAVEVRATFWDETLTATDVRPWIAAVQGRKSFQFSVKLHRSFTHDRTIRPAQVKTMQSLLRELARHNRLGALLMQFPYGFTNTGANRHYLTTLAEVFREFPMYVELRHSSWDTSSLLPFLTEHAMRSVSADLPKVRQYMPFLTGVVGDTAYLRLHGRNEKGWLLNGYDTRYDYLYNGRELMELRRRLDALAGRCSQAVIVCNNTTGGKAVANAFQLTAALRQGAPVAVPPATFRAFPLLQDLCFPREAGQTLFDQTGLRTAI